MNYKTHQPHPQHKPIDIITLFHKAASPTSVRIAAALRQASAAASETATEDQASDHTAQSHAVRRPEFKLEITETPPTVDQLRTILDYVGKAKVGTIVKGATDQEEALRRFGEDVENLRRPVVCSFFSFFFRCCRFFGLPLAVVTYLLPYYCLGVF